MADEGGNPGFDEVATQARERSAARGAAPPADAAEERVGLAHLVWHLSQDAMSCGEAVVSRALVAALGAVGASDGATWGVLETMEIDARLVAPENAWLAAEMAVVAEGARARLAGMEGGDGACRGQDG